VRTLDVCKPLLDVASIFNGKTPSKDQQREMGHPVLKIKDVSEDGTFTGHFASFVDEELARLIQRGGELVLTAVHNTT